MRAILTAANVVKRSISFEKTKIIRVLYFSMFMNTLKGNFDTLQEKVMASLQKWSIFRFQSQFLGSKTQLILIEIIFALEL